MGDKGGKTDMDRIGLFQEMTYVTIGDRYKSTAGHGFNDTAGKGKQMLPGGSKERSALQMGYFAEKYGRVFDGEAYSDPIKLRRVHRLQESKKNLSKPFLPSSGDKKASGLGNHYGTLSGPVLAFSPVGKASKSGKVPGKNVLTNPGRHGTGYGYVGVTLAKYPNNMTDPYENDRERARKEVAQHKASMKAGAFRLNLHPSDFFDGNPYRTDKPLPPVRKTISAGPKDVKPFKPSSPGKKPGGSKIGTFETYPKHSEDSYNPKLKRHPQVVNKSGKIFMPSQGPKSVPTHSILDQNVVRTINVQNYRSATIA
ncbi:hypothetical protein ACOMHN_039486 [Nucella lapillus]